MPFASKRQWRAAFAGLIPGIDKEKAREWAHETTKDFSKLPDRSPSEKGKATLRTKKSSLSVRRGQQAGFLLKQLKQQGSSPGMAKNYVDAGMREKERHKRANDALIEAFSKLAFAIPGPGQVRQITSQSVGQFRGTATNNFLKPPGPAASTKAVNPRLSVGNAMLRNTAATTAR